MNVTRIIFSVVIASGALAACGKEPTAEETEAKVKALTIEATGAVAGQSVTVSPPEAKGRRRVWQATVDGRVFSCDADDSYRLPSCELAQPGA